MTAPLHKPLHRTPRPPAQRPRVGSFPYGDVPIHPRLENSMSASTHDVNRQSVHSGVRSLGSVIRRCAKAVLSWRERQRAAGHLMMLDDRMLKDIGVARGQIAAMVH